MPDGSISRSGSELIFISNRIYPGDGDPFPGYVRVRGSKILDVGTGVPGGSRKGTPQGKDSFGRPVPASDGSQIVIDVGDYAVIPGLIDLHIHGSGGFDVASGDVAQLEGLSRFLAENGVTAFQPTVGAAPVADMERAIMAGRALCEAAQRQSSPRRGTGHTNASEDDGRIAAGDMREYPAVGARPLGLHLEGPFLNPGRPGAIPARCLLEPDWPLVDRWLTLAVGSIGRVTLAPELSGALDLVHHLKDAGITVSMGHTLADYDEALAGFAAGITVATHTFNAMREFHHRQPGALGAALTQKGIYCELIADGIHVHPGAMALLAATQGKDSICLVSDAFPAAGLRPGTYEFLGQLVALDDRGRATLPDGTLAGSSALLRHCLRNMVELVGVAFADALRMATVNPAKAAGVYDRKGSLAPGKDADIVVLSADYEVVWSLVEGAVAKAPRE